MKADWDAWNSRSLAEEPIVRLIRDGTVVRVRLDCKATSIVLLVVLGVHQDGPKALLAVKNMGGETSQAWRAVLDDVVKRGLRQPEFLIVDGGTGLEQALAALLVDGAALGRNIAPQVHARRYAASTYCRSCAFSAPVPSSTFLLWLRAKTATPSSPTRRPKRQ